MTNEPYNTKEASLDQAKNNFNFPELSYQLIFDDKDIDISLNDTLILFYARWSGPSIANIRRILATVAKHDVPTLKIFIADIDFISDAFKNIYLGQLTNNGYGEAVWLENGQIKARHTYQSDFVPFIVFISKKLKKKT